MHKKSKIKFDALSAFVSVLIVSASLPASAETLLPERLRSHVKVLASDIGARSLNHNSRGLERAASYIQEQFIASGYAPSRQTFSVGSGDTAQSTANIIVECPGVSKPSEVVIIGAHYDGAHDCPAANDNGSGVAALLEIAKAFAKQKCERTVRFVAFTNEEPPYFRTDYMGSYRYAKSCKDRGDNIVAMLSLETIGYYSDAPNSQRFPVPALAKLYPTTGNFLTFIGQLDSREQLAKCATTFIAASNFPAQSLAAPPDMTGVDFSDQQSFWRLGYPGIMVTDTALYRYPHYHTKYDTLDKINYDSFARVTNGLSAVVTKLANE